MSVLTHGSEKQWVRADAEGLSVVGMTTYIEGIYSCTLPKLSSGYFMC